MATSGVSLSFNVEWFDNQAGFVRSYILKFTPQDQHIEMVRPLRRVLTHSSPRGTPVVFTDRRGPSHA
jgi:hypothetical protein